MIFKDVAFLMGDHRKFYLLHNLICFLYLFKDILLKKFFIIMYIFKICNKIMIFELL